jgi:acetyl esterase/lipase
MPMGMTARVLLVVAALVATACGSNAAASVPSSFAGVTATTVTYCTDGGAAQTLDVYEPAGGSSPHPLLVVIHGGSWAFGSSALREQNPLTQMVVTSMLGRGFAVASINYRLAPADPWPSQIIDARCAIRYLRATAPRWRVDPRRFTVVGNSAGAHLASLAALSDGQVPQWDTGQYRGESSGFAAVVDCWGPADLTAPGWSSTAEAIGRPVFGAAWGSNSDALRVASPADHVHPGAPPFLIIQGSSDTLVPPQQSAELRDRLLASGDAATLVAVAHAGHELRPTAGPISPDLGTLTEQVVAFLVSVAG